MAMLMLMVPVALSAADKSLLGLEAFGAAILAAIALGSAYGWYRKGFPVPFRSPYELLEKSPISVNSAQFEFRVKVRPKLEMQKLDVQFKDADGRDQDEIRVTQLVDIHRKGTHTQRETNGLGREIEYASPIVTRRGEVLLLEIQFQVEGAIPPSWNGFVSFRGWDEHGAAKKLRRRFRYTKVLR